jgi:hypothetical protein
MRLRSGPVTVAAGGSGPSKEEAVMRVEESIIIDRPAEDVFGFLSVRTNDPVQAIGRREFLDEGTEYEPGRRIAHRLVAGPMVIHTACLAEPAGSGCRATVLYEPECFPGGSWAG